MKNNPQEQKKEEMKQYFQEENQDVPKEKSRPIPRSDLDFNLMTTNPEWGGQSIPDNLKQELKLKSEQKIDHVENIPMPDGSFKQVVYVKEEVPERNIWELMGSYTRDIRLGNLDAMELEDARHYLNLAQDTTNEKYPMATKTALTRVATILETSHSKKGWFRKILSTFIKREEHITLDEPKKKSFLGGNSKSYGG